MKNSRAFSLLITGLSLAVGAACSSDRAPVAPIDQDTDKTAVAPSASLLGTVDDAVTTTSTGLLLCNVEQTTYGEALVGPSGGVVHVGPHSLVIPRGALKSDTRITGKAPKGNTVLVEFQPHGLRFDVPTALTISYRECGLTGSLLSLLFDVVYVDGSQKILEILPSFNDVVGQRVTGRVDHFSGYALADRKGNTADDPTLSGY